MGYMLSSLAELPIEEGVKFYIFVVNEMWRGDTSQLLEDNFGLIAQRIGSENIVAKGLEEKWSESVLAAYFGGGWEKLSPLLPGLLITNAHPKALSKKSLRILVSLDKVQAQFGSFDHFFTSLTDFVSGRNTDFLSHIEEKKDYIRKIAKTMELKPNFFGVGINLNEIIELLLNLGRRKKH